MYRTYIYVSGQKPLKCQSNALRLGFMPGIVITGYIEVRNIVVTRKHCLPPCSPSLQSSLYSSSFLSFFQREEKVRELKRRLQARNQQLASSNPQQPQTQQRVTVRIANGGVGGKCDGEKTEVGGGEAITKECDSALPSSSTGGTKGSDEFSNGYC
jgi:hypothetical protein